MIRLASLRVLLAAACATVGSAGPDQEPRTLPVVLEGEAHGQAQFVCLKLEVSEDVTILLDNDLLTWEQFRRLDFTKVNVRYLVMRAGKLDDVRLRSWR